MGPADPPRPGLPGPPGALRGLRGRLLRGRLDGGLEREPGLRGEDDPARAARPDRDGGPGAMVTVLGGSGVQSKQVHGDGGGVAGPGRQGRGAPHLS